MDMNEKHEANRKGWDAVTKAERADGNACDWRTCHRNPSLVLDQREMKWLDDVAGKRACVLGSGDNRVVFALAGLGADVTSVDISDEQLNIARARAETLGLDITFHRADVTDLSGVATGAFDVVYTGGHVAVWVSDLRTYYAEAVRILKPGGLFIVNEYHPVRRIWDDTQDHLAIRFNYFDLGPHQWDRADDVPGAEPGSLPSFEFHWTVSQYLMAVLDAGCDLVAVDEVGDQPEAHERGALMAGLPGCLLIVARKRQPSANGSSVSP